VPLHITMWQGPLSVRIICTGQQVDLLASPVYFGGFATGSSARYERRCAILLMPPAEQEFACRTCHDLIYSSSSDLSIVEGLMVESKRMALAEKRRRKCSAFT
jgi:hypothetical protein